MTTPPAPNAYLAGVAPALLSTTVNDGTAQRSRITSFTIIFTESVTLSDGALSLVRYPFGGTAMSVDVTLSNPSNDHRIYLLTFPSSQDGSLPDGFYVLTLSAANISSTTSGLHLSADQTANFFALAGDGNGDGAVTGSDYTIWADHYGQTTSQGPNAGDFDGNGTVSGADYTLWADRYDFSVWTIPHP
jgi:hypothetical protein